MSEQNGTALRRLAERGELQPPAWIAEMRKHYLEHGTYRIEDVARLLGDQTRSLGSIPQRQGSTTIELLQQMAAKK